MNQDILAMTVMWIGIYAAVGTLFAVYFVVWGARHLDPGHEHSSLLARIILTPGIIALWPYLMVRMAVGAKFTG
jgi:hypothetical protein